MNIWGSVPEGIGGTALMTFFIYVLSFITRERFKVVKILGTMVTGQTRPDKSLSNTRSSIATGTVLHYFVGILFSLTYNWLWSNGIGAPNLKYCLLFGIISGLIAVCIWKGFFMLHPNPPAVCLPSYLLVIFLGHVVFGTGVYLVYRSLTSGLLF